MASLTLTRHIARPRDEVFAVFADLERAPERVRGIESLELLTEGPVGEGTRFRETREMFGKRATEEMEVTAFDPPAGYVVECRSHGTLYRAAYDFVEADDVTEVGVRFEARPVSLLARLLSPLGYLMMGATRKALAADLDDLAAFLMAVAAVNPDTGPPDAP